jgi:hypothetical protein
MHVGEFIIVMGGFMAMLAGLLGIVQFMGNRED